MEAIATFLGLIAVIAAVDLVAWRWGVDSRDQMRLDHDR
jgi:hypothetical protein